MAIRQALAALFLFTLSACVTRLPATPAIVESLPVAADQCLFGCPVGPPSAHTVVGHHVFTLSNNPATKFADWVAYKVSRDAIGPGGDRIWKADPNLSDSETLEPNDYEGASATFGYDRGHQAPLASFGNTHFADETNYLSNITPQKAALNQGSWARLEDAERRLAKSPPYPIVYVVTGPLYDRAMPALPGAKDEPHQVPSGYWKVVALADGRVAAFIFDQMTPRAESFCEHLTTVAAIETLSKLDIMPKSAIHLTELAPALNCPRQ